MLGQPTFIAGYEVPLHRALTEPILIVGAPRAFAIIEFKLTTLAGFVLLPFALFGQTAFLAERVLGNVISSGIKLMVLAIAVGIGSSIFGTLVRPTADITLTQAASTILAAIAVFGLAIFVPGIAAGLITGAPQLGAGAAVATTAATGGTVVAGGMLGSGAARLAGRAARGAIKAAASLTGTVGAAYQAGGIRGVARATVTAPASRAAASGTAPVRDAYREGTAQGYWDAGPSTGPDPRLSLYSAWIESPHSSKVVTFDDSGAVESCWHLESACAGARFPASLSHGCSLWRVS